MKTLTNLIFLILILLCVPVFLYFMYTKTYASGQMDLNAPTKLSSSNDIQIKNAEIARLRKENTELKARELRPLAQPPRRFGQGGQPTNPNSQSPLSQPPRRVGQGSSSRDSYQEYSQADELYE